RAPDPQPRCGASRQSFGGRRVAPIQPMIRESALQIRAITRRETHRSEMDVDDADGARGGNAKTNMAGSMLIAVNQNETYLLSRVVSGLRGVIRCNGRRGWRERLRGAGGGKVETACGGGRSAFWRPP